jgi:excisionase family DNA binding protein
VSLAEIERTAPLDPLRGYTLTQACELIPCSRTHAYRAMKAGKLRFSRDGAKLLIQGHRGLPAQRRWLSPGRPERGRADRESR